MKSFTLNKAVMKTLFGGGALMLSILSFSSCSSETEMPGTPGDKTTRITLSVPAEVVSRSYAQGEHVNQLTYAVYVHDEVNDAPGMLVSTEKRDAEFDSNGHYSLDIELVNGKAYDFIFWADNKESGAYSFNANNHTISMTDAAFASNKDEVDAFYGTLTTPVIDGAYAGQVDLYRPFAQLNLGASDLDDEIFNKVHGISDQKVYTKLTVDTYRSFDIWNGVCTGKTTPVTYSMPADAIDLSKNKFPYKEDVYDYVSMHYLLMSKKTAEQESDIVELKYEFFNAPDATEPFYSIEVPNVPVRQNYMTNIYGRIFTDSGSISVDIQKDIYEMTWPIGATVVKTTDELVDAVNNAKSGTVVVIPVGTAVTVSANYIGGDSNNDIEGYFIEPQSDVEIRVDGTLAFTGVAQIVPMGGAKVTLSGNGTVTSDSSSFLLRADEGDIVVSGGLTLKVDGIAGLGYAINGHSLSISDVDIVGDIKASGNYVPNGVLAMAEGGTINIKNTTITSNSLVCSYINTGADIEGQTNMNFVAENCRFINNVTESNENYYRRYAFETYTGKTMRYEFTNSAIASNTGCVHVYSGGTLIFKGNGKITGNGRMANFKNPTEYGKTPVVVESGATGLQFNNICFVYNEWNEEDATAPTVVDKGVSTAYMMASYYTGPTQNKDGELIAAYKGYSWTTLGDTFKNGQIMNLSGETVDKTSVFRYSYSK